MNYLDVILIIPLLWGLYKGFTKGFIIEIATLISLGLAIWGAIKFSDFFTQWLKEFTGWTTKYIPVISFALIFIGILVLVYAIAKLIERLVKAVSLGFVNRLAGGIFGMLKFGLILSILIFMIHAVERSFPVLPSELKQKSLLYEPVGKIAPAVIPGLRQSKLTGWLAEAGPGH